MIKQDIQHHSISASARSSKKILLILLSSIGIAVIGLISYTYISDETKTALFTSNLLYGEVSEGISLKKEGEMLREEDPLGDIPFYNPYEIEFMMDDEYSISGNMVTLQGYDSKKHLKALNRLTSGLRGPADFTLDPRTIPEGANNKFVQNVSFSFDMIDYYRGKMTIGDANNKRYSIPDYAVNKPGTNKMMRAEMMGFKLFHNPFSFQFGDLRNASNLYLTSNESNLVVMDKFLQIDFELPSQRLFGFGERISSFQLQEGTWTMWAREPTNCSYDDGTGGKQGYGVHPFVMVQGFQKGDFFGIFFRNSNAQSPLIRFNLNGGTTLSYITTGGQLEIEFFIHGSPSKIISEYLNSIGKPSLPPLWSLGWGQSSYAYTDIGKVKEMVSGYTNGDFPLEHVWLDVPYMKKFTDFTVDTDAFPNLSQYADELHHEQKRLVVILDPGLSADDISNKYYQKAQLLDCLVKSQVHPDYMNGAIVAKMFSEQTVFLDWFNTQTYSVWSDGLRDLYEQTHFDGLWLDLGEITIFCSGECPKDQLNKEKVDSVIKRMLKEGPETAQIVRDDNSWYYSFSDQATESTYFLPFIPGYEHQGNLDAETLSLNATHAETGFTEYNVHNLNGLMESEYTYNFLTQDSDYPKNDERAFILSRSTFAGSGRYTSHWLGDNWRDWQNMKNSIAGIMSMNMFGIPHTGADICGFYGEKLDQELCARWIQLAQFYPLARMHYNQTYNGNPNEGTEPYKLEGQWKDIARNSIYARYQYLRLMYTCLYEAQEFGSTCFDPLFYYFPEDDKTFENIESTFMVAGALKVSPILEPGITDTYTSYFPKGNWVSMRDYNEIVKGGQDVQLRAHPTVNVHIRPGKVVPFQDNSNLEIKTSRQLIETPIQLVANRDEAGIAKGSLLLDRGLSRKEMYSNQYEYYQFSIQANSLQKYLTRGTHGAINQYFDSLVILDAEDLRNTDFACVFTANLERHPLDFEYDTVAKTLTIRAQKEVEYYFFSFFRSMHWGSMKNGDVNICEQNSYYLKLKDGEKPDLEFGETTFTLEAYMPGIPDVEMNLKVVENNMVNVHWKIKDLPEGWRKSFEVPEEIIANKPPRLLQSLSRFVKYYNNHFILQIISRSGAIVAQIEEFHLGQYFNTATVQLNTTKGDAFHGIMGLGERVTENLFYEDGVYTQWNKDSALPFDLGVPPGANIYGSHPFFMFKNANDLWVGCFVKIANAVDWYVENNPGTGIVKLYQLAIGGVGDYTFIIDNTPNEITASYLEIVGRPALIPQWALGWHQCRWGYETLDKVKEVVEQYDANDLPLDVQWSDIDYMYSYRDFTYDHLKYEGLEDFIHDLHAENRRYVPILDAGIAERPKGTYPAFDFGVEQNAFIKINDEELLTGQVWPKDAVYVDWFSVNGSHWWQNELYYMHKSILFDGLWQDMNEASDFCNGICYEEQRPKSPIKDKTFYTPGLRDLEEKQMSLDGIHQNGYLQYDTHNLYGIMMAKATQEFFHSLNMRTFSISRSSFAGHGKFGQKWLGDNFSNVHYMAQSVHGIMMMNTFGIPFVGSDVCGFIGQTNPELCARWYVVAAFQPFSRNHNDFSSMSQEPYVFKNEFYEENISYTDVIRMAMRAKLCLIRYYYSILHQMTDVGGPQAYRPLFYDYPNDEKAYENTTNNVLLGPALKISHLANELGVNQTDFYFPKGTYCDIFKPMHKCFTSKGTILNFETKIYDFYAHLRQGSAIPLQNAYQLNAKTTVDLQKEPVDLHVLGQDSQISPADWYAYGLYINDDGLKRDIKGNFNKYEFEITQFKILGITQLQVQVKTQYATNYDPKDNSNCFEINKNDYVKNLYFYNAQAVESLHRFSADITYVNGTKAQAPDATYDADTDRLVLELDSPQCLPAIAIINLIKQN